MFPDLVIVKEPGTKAILKFEITGIEPNGIERQFETQPLTQLFLSRPCLAGEEQTIEGTCRKCPYGFYLLEPPTEVTNCHKCDDTKAECPGDNLIIPKPGYFRVNPDTAEIVECVNPEACIGGDEVSTYGSCTAGYTGFMCGSCATNWVKSTWEECSECPSITTSVIWAALRLTFFAALVLTICWLLHRISTSHNSQYMSLVSLAKLLINHCVIMAAISDIKYYWSPTLSAVVNVQTLLVSLLSRFINFDCILNGTTDLSADNSDSFYRHLVFTILLPPLSIIGFTVLFGLYQICRASKHSLGDQFICMTVVTYWLLLPQICHAVFKSISCVEMGDGESRLSSDMEIVCWEGTHRQIVNLVSLPASVFYLILIPIFFLYKLKSDRKQVAASKSLKGKALLKEQDRQTAFTARFGFLLLGMRKDYFYWELVVLARKAIIIFACEFLGSVSSDVQVLVAILICVVNLMANIYIRPLQSKMENAIDIFSQCVQMTLLYNGLFYITGYQSYLDPDSGVNWFFLCVIFIPSLCFLIMWVLSLKKQVLIVAYGNNRNVFKALTLGLVDQKKFKKTNIDNDDLEEDTPREDKEGNTSAIGDRSTL